MLIDRRVGSFVIDGTESVRAGLNKISANRARVLFVADSHGHLIGSVSDGDIRRWLTSTTAPDLSVAIETVANRSARSFPVSAVADSIEAALSSVITHLPLLDEQGRIVAVASADGRHLQIGRHRVSLDDPALMIAEIGNNHQGSVGLAKELVDLAVGSGADVVKFQLRDMDALYRQRGAATAGEDLGAQYTVNLLAKYSLSADQMCEVFDHCRGRDIDVICTPWDLPSVAVLADYGIPALKVASADLTNHQLLEEVFQTGLPLIVSTGMSTEDEIKEAIALLQTSASPWAMLHCQSTYPAPFKDVNLNYLKRLADLTGRPVGYSGHERGHHIPLAAVALGARIIEKHFTIDRELEGNDHKVSLLPAEFATMVARVRELEQAMGDGAARVVSTGESMNRVTLAKSLVAARRLEAGELIGADDVVVKSPGRGLQPNRLTSLIGRHTHRVIEQGDFFYPGDLADAASGPRPYRFRRPWGLPVRFHDHARLIRDVTPDFLEFHLSYKDVELDPDEVFSGRLPMDFTVHLPDLYDGDFVVDLASADDQIWERSIEELERVVQLTRRLTEHFDITQPPTVIATMGGFTTDGFVDASARPAMYARIARALDRVDSSEVLITAQTLPPFPWLFGGQQHHNLFVELEDTVDFCSQYGVRLTLDTSHSKLATNFHRRSFSEHVEQLAPHVAHLHLVDAVGIDGEGTQIGEGEIDWPLLARQLDERCSGVGFIPEIWMGHTNGGEGFWTALERLEQWF